jgi:hypothetical protein
MCAQYGIPYVYICSACEIYLKVQIWLKADRCLRYYTTLGILIRAKFTELFKHKIRGTLPGL